MMSEGQRCSKVHIMILKIMYEIPSRDDVEKCIITRATVDNGADPTLVLDEQKKEDAELALEEEKKISEKETA